MRRLDIDPAFHGATGLVAELGLALGELASFNGCDQVVLENVHPKKFLAALKKILAAANA